MLLSVACAACSAPVTVWEASGRAITSPSLDEVGRQAAAIDLGGRSALGTIASDLAAAPVSIWSDVSSLVTSADNLTVLGITAAAGALAQRAYGSDWTPGSDHLSSGTSNALESAGDGAYLFAIAGGLYGWGVAQGDSYAYLAGRTALASMATSTVLTTALKVIVNEDRPNGGQHGYPSGHTALSMALASTLQTSYGWEVGLPLYLLAAGVAYQRYDSGAHDIDDIMLGAVIGFLSARHVHRQRNIDFLGARVAPFVSPDNGAVGLGLNWSF